MADALSFQDALEKLKPATPEEATEETTETVEAETPEVEAEAAETQEIEVEFEEDTEEIPPVDMPNSWSKDDADDWNALTPAAQQKWAKREGEQRSESSRRYNELSDQKKALEAESEQTKQKQAELLEALKAVQVQKPSPDMLDTDHDDYNADEYHRQNALWEKSQAKVTELTGEIQQQQTEDFTKWQVSQAELYKQHWPEFLDKEKGTKLHGELIIFAADKMGMSQEQATQALQTTNFHQMSILNDAMKYRQALEKAKTKKVKPKSKSLKGGTSNPSKPVIADKVALAQAFKLDPSKKNALALMEAK